MSPADDRDRLTEFVDGAGDAGVTRTEIWGIFNRNIDGPVLERMLADPVETAGYEEIKRPAAVGRPALAIRRKPATEEDLAMTAPHDNEPKPPRYKVVHAAVSRLVDGNFTVHRRGDIIDLTPAEAERLTRLEAVEPVPADTPDRAPEPPMDDALPDWLGTLDELPRFQPSAEPFETLQIADVYAEYDKHVSMIGVAPQTESALQEHLETAQALGEGTNTATWNLNAHRLKAKAAITAARGVAAEIVFRVRAGEASDDRHQLGQMYHDKPHNYLVAAVYRQYVDGSDAA